MRHNSVKQSIHKIRNFGRSLQQTIKTFVNGSQKTRVIKRWWKKVDNFIKQLQKKIVNVIEQSRNEIAKVVEHSWNKIVNVVKHSWNKIVNLVKRSLNNVGFTIYFSHHVTPYYIFNIYSILQTGFPYCFSPFFIFRLLIGHLFTFGLHNSAELRAYKLYFSFKLS